VGEERAANASSPIKRRLTYVNAPNFGVITATRGIPRQLQIALKVRFYACI